MTTIVTLPASSVTVGMTILTDGAPTVVTDLWPGGFFTGVARGVYVEGTLPGSVSAYFTN